MENWHYFLIAIAIIFVLWMLSPKEGAWFKKKPERMAVGNVFAGTTYGIQGRQRGDFFVPSAVVPSNTPAITGWIVPGVHASGTVTKVGQI